MKTLARIVCVSLAFFVPVARIGADNVQQAPQFYDAAKLTFEQARGIREKRIKLRARIIFSKPCTAKDGSSCFLCQVGGKCEIWAWFFGNSMPSDEQMKQELLIEGEMLVFPSDPSQHVTAQIHLYHAKIVKPCLDFCATRDLFVQKRVIVQSPKSKHFAALPTNVVLPTNPKSCP